MNKKLISSAVLSLLALSFFSESFAASAPHSEDKTGDVVAASAPHSESDKTGAPYATVAPKAKKHHHKAHKSDTKKK